MSEFLAEARILVRPDTTGFRAELEAALKLATVKPITIPVTPVVVGGIAAVTTETNAFTKAQLEGAAATKVQNDALKQQALLDKELAASQAEREASLSQLTRGASRAGLSLVGLNSATLAASGAFIAGAAAVIGFGKAVQSAASLQTELNVFKVTAGATADEMARVSAEAQALGKDLTLPGVTANDAAVALTELSKAGLSVQDSLAGARGALQLATAAQIDNVEATKLVAGALNTFGLAGTEAVRVADLLTGAAKESQGEITDFGPALAQVGAVATQFGVSIGDTVTLLTELAQAGLQGGRAGTSLRVAFLRLINPTTAAAKELDKLGIAVRDANGNLKPGVFTDIADALQSYTKAQRDAALATIFGSDAIRAAAIIGNKGTLAFLATSASVNESGLAQQQAAARTAGLQGATENLKNQVSALGLEIGQVTTGPLKSLVNGLASVAQNATATVTGLTNLGKKLDELGNKGDAPVKLSDRIAGGIENIGKKSTLFISPVATLFALSAAELRLLGLAVDKTAGGTKGLGEAFVDTNTALGDLGTNLLQSAADSKIFTAQVTADTAKLLQSAADSRIGSNGNAFTAPKPPPEFGVTQIQNIVQGFDAKQVRDRIAKNDAQLISDLRAEQAFLIRELQKQGVQNRPALKRALEQALLGAGNDLDAIFAKQASDAKAAKDKATQIAKDRLAAAAKLAASKLELINATLTAKLSAAQLTKGIDDDKRILNLQIKAAQDDLKKNQRIADAAKKGSQAQVDAAIQVQKDIQTINGIKQQIKNLNGGNSNSGFSLSDLFREGVSQFAQFGSNIASRNGLLSAQDARAQLGGTIAQIAGAQLTEAQRQTALLESIDQNTKLGKGKPSAATTKQVAQTFSSVTAELAATFGF